MRKAGTGVQPPKLETAEVAQLIERTITATDNLCGDIVRFLVLSFLKTTFWEMKNDLNEKLYQDRKIWYFRFSEK